MTLLTEEHTTGFLSKSIVFSGLLFLLLLDVTASRAQNADTIPKRGFFPGGSYALSELESISTTSGNLSYRIPLASLPPGRGGFSHSVGLVYNSKLYDEFTGVVYPDGLPITVEQLYPSPHGGWRPLGSPDYQLFTRYKEPLADVGCPVHYLKTFVSYPDGSVHEFRPVGYQHDGTGYFPINPGGCVWDCSGIQPVTSANMTYYSTDGTYTKLVVDHGSVCDWTLNAWELFLPDGSRVRGGDVTVRFRDRNDNLIKTLDVTYNGNPATKIVDDYTGRAIVIEHRLADGTDFVHVTGFNNDPVTYTVTHKDVGGGSYNTLGSDGVTRSYGLPFLVAVDQVILPPQAGSQAYTCTYTTDPPPGGFSGGAAELRTMTLPTGARVEYRYYSEQAPNDSIESVMENHIARKDLIYLHEYDNEPPQTITDRWDYDFPVLPSEGGTTTITGPDGGQTKEWYYGHLLLGSFNPATDWKNGLVYKTERPDDTVIERIWNPNTPYGTPLNESLNPYLKAEFISIKDAGGTLVKTATKDFNRDKNGNVLQTAEYDWVNWSDVPRDANGPTGPPPTPVARVTVNEYWVATPEASVVGSAANDPDAYYNQLSPRLRDGVKSSEVRSDFAESAVLSRTELFYDDPTTTGNLITQKRWDSYKGGTFQPITRDLTPTNSISVTNEYLYGNVTLATDAGGVQTQFTYGSVGGFINLYPTHIVTALGTAVARATDTQYDFYTGLATRVTDADNNVATATTYDVFGRPILSKVADGKPEESDTVTAYSDVDRRVILKADLTAAGDGKLVSVEHYDQLGRVRLSRQLENESLQSATDETTGIKVQTRYLYSGTNSYKLRSNPYRATTSALASNEETMGWTRRKDDKGGRVIEVQTFSGAALPAPWGSNTSSTGAVTNSYNANATTVTDQAGNPRRSLTDGLGRLVRVDEPNASGQLDDAQTPPQPVQPTSYQYDALNDSLVQVTQGSQHRYFLYDSLSRLIRCRKPEEDINPLIVPVLTEPLTGNNQWSMKYTYYPNSNLEKRTDARNITTTYAYDALNRPTLRTYSAHPENTPNVAYSYGAAGVAYSKGRLTQVMAQSSSFVSVCDYLEYDALGRVKQSRQTTDGQPAYAFSYTYNRAGAITTETYPSGRVIETEYDTAGRFSGVKNQGTQAYYAGGIPGFDTVYTPHGATQNLLLGNGRREQTHFNSRLQPTQITLDSNSQTSKLLTLSYGYGTTNNNGNLLSQTIIAGNGGPTMSQTYSYDWLNRIKEAKENNGSSWSEQFAYDRFGNMWVPTYSGITLSLLTPQSSSAFAPGLTNRLTASPNHYDATGNQDTDVLSRSFTYDAENRQVSFNGTVGRYFYDGDGHRVKKIYGSETTIFVYNVGGQLIAEYTTATPTGGDTSYLTTDHLGSTRVVTDSGGNIRARYDYLPFGGEIPLLGGRNGALGYGAADTTRQKFTQKERDSESGLDYFLARYYSSAQGRFTSVDSSVQGVKLVNPQSLNHYCYARNSPLVYIDRNGKWPTKIHNRIIDNAFPGLSEKQREVLKHASAKEDELIPGQSAFNAYKHGMRSPWQSVEEASRLASHFIFENEQLAMKYRDMRFKYQDANSYTPSNWELEAFGAALHTITDMLSPTHKGFQEWAGELSIFDDTASFLFTVPDHIAGEENIADEQMEEAVNAARLAYRKTFGDRHLEVAITRKETGQVTAPGREHFRLVIERKTPEWMNDLRSRGGLKAGDESR